jgi:hypothetical protein
MATPAADGAVKLLWTGGWDSSFRLMQLVLVERRPVQPIYVLRPGRDSLRQEIEAMARMRRGIVGRTSDPSLLAWTHIVSSAEHQPRPELEEMRRSLLRSGWIGPQYVALAGIAEDLGWKGVELCIERYPSGFSAWQQVVFDAPGRLNDAPEAALFRAWSFPVMHLTKMEMAAAAREHGFYDLLLERWFCLSPIRGKACGRCNPCKLALRDGVTEGIPFAGPVEMLASRVTRTARKVLRAWPALGR